jgi:hypothetical protein
MELSRYGRALILALILLGVWGFVSLIFKFEGTAAVAIFAALWATVLVVAIRWYQSNRKEN